MRFQPKILSFEQVKINLLSWEKNASLIISVWPYNFLALLNLLLSQTSTVKSPKTTKNNCENRAYLINIIGLSKLCELSNFPE